MIARSLDSAEGTLKLHVKRLLNKLGMRSRTEAAVWVVENELNSVVNFGILQGNSMHVPAAAVIHSGAGEGDALLEAILTECQQQGWRVRGLVTQQGKDPQGILPMQLRDLNTGKIFSISQELGRNAQGCTLDMGGLVEAGQVLRNALNEQPDLVFINRFGYGEARGRGLSQEFTQLISAGIPVLTLVSEKYLENWQAFSAGLAQTLPLERAAIIRWLTRIEPAHLI